MTGRRAFISYNPAPLDQGLAAIDQVCADDATIYNQPAGTYKAFVADNGTTAVSRFNLTGDTWVRWDGVPIVDDPADLAESGINLLAPIAKWANGQYMSFGVRVIGGGGSDPSLPGAGARPATVGVRPRARRPSDVVLGPKVWTTGSTRRIATVTTPGPGSSVFRSEPERIAMLLDGARGSPRPRPAAVAQLQLF